MGQQTKGTVVTDSDTIILRISLAYGIDYWINVEFSYTINTKENGLKQCIFSMSKVLIKTIYICNQRL